MKIAVTGYGIWARGICGPAQLQAVLQGTADGDAEFIAPKPGLIPARELRRSPLLVRLAVEVATQACAMAGIEPAKPASIFTSGMGDSAISDEICRAVNEPEVFVSPTRFHNSVHNAPGGYWAIAAQNHQSSTFISAREHSFGIALLNAAMQADEDGAPVLLVAEDTRTRPPFSDVMPIAEDFAMALIITPAGQAPDAPVFELSLEQGGRPWPVPRNARLQALAADNPSARGLALLEHLACGPGEQLGWACDGGAQVTVSLGYQSGSLSGALSQPQAASAGRI